MSRAVSTTSLVVPAMGDTIAAGLWPGFDNIRIKHMGLRMCPKQLTELEQSEALQTDTVLNSFNENEKILQKITKDIL